MPAVRCVILPVHSCLPADLRLAITFVSYIIHIPWHYMRLTYYKYASLTSGINHYQSNAAFTDRYPSIRL